MTHHQSPSRRCADLTCYEPEWNVPERMTQVLHLSVWGSMISFINLLQISPRLILCNTHTFVQSGPVNSFYRDRLRLSGELEHMDCSLFLQLRDRSEAWTEDESRSPGGTCTLIFAPFFTSFQVQGGPDMLVNVVPMLSQDRSGLASVNTDISVY